MMFKLKTKTFEHAGKIFLLLAYMITACEQDIAVDLQNADAPVAVDAWLYHKAEDQVIDFYIANTYFDNSNPTGIQGASITVSDINTNEVYTFNEADNGRYIWTPANETDTFGIVGNTYALMIQWNETTYESVSTLNDVPTLDSITWRFEEANAFSEEDFFVGEFWARDLDGEGDTYWIKSWKNGQLLNKPSEINLAFDGAFSSESNADGLVFIEPIRDAVTPFEEDDDGFLIPPFLLPFTVEVQDSIFNETTMELDTVIISDSLVFDSLFVEINSVTEEAWFFLQSAQIQTDRGGNAFAELFATPLANVQSNIFSDDPNEKVVGFFCVSATSGLGRRFTEDAVRGLPE